MIINRILTNICSYDITKTASFYTSLFNFKIEFTSDWFIHLISENKTFEIGILQSENELIPEEYRGKPNGMYVTLVVDDAESIYLQAKKLNYIILQEPELTKYGQKRILLKDPAGVLVDVSSPDE